MFLPGLSPVSTGRSRHRWASPPGTPTNPSSSPMKRPFLVTDWTIANDGFTKEVEVLLPPAYVPPDPDESDRMRWSAADFERLFVRAAPAEGTAVRRSEVDRHIDELRRLRDRMTSEVLEVTATAQQPWGLLRGPETDVAAEGAQMQQMRERRAPGGCRCPWRGCRL